MSGLRCFAALALGAAVLAGACAPTPETVRPSATPIPTPDAHTVTGIVYADHDGDGLATRPGEAPLPNVTVVLSGCGTPSRVLTGPDGRFAFPNLADNASCALTANLPGWQVSGSVPAPYPIRITVDGRPQPAVGIFLTDAAVLTASGGGGQIDGQVFIDANNNRSLADPGDGPATGADVWLAGCGELRRTVAGTAGDFHFGGVPSGVCLVEVTTRDNRVVLATDPLLVYPPALTITPASKARVTFYLSRPNDAQPTPSPSPVPTATPLTSPVPTTGFSFAPQPTTPINPVPSAPVPSGPTPAPGGTILGQVFGDANSSDPNSPPTDGPLPGVTVHLTGCGPKTISGVTDSQGKFRFTSVPTGICLLSLDKTGYTFYHSLPNGFAYPIRVFSAPYSSTPVGLVMLRL